MKRRAVISFIICSAIFALLGGVADVYANAPTTPLVYSVTFTKFELKKQDGTYVSVWSGTATVDLAQLASGNFADMAVLENMDVPPGTYTAFRASLDKTMSVSCDDGAVQTDGGTASQGAGLGSVPTAEVATGNPRAGYLVIPDALLTGGVYLFEQAFAGPVTVADGDVMGDFEIEINIDGKFISFDTTGMGGPYIYQPTGATAAPDVTVNLPAGY